jgi:hypothetical protein
MTTSSVHVVLLVLHRPILLVIGLAVIRVAHTPVDRQFPGIRVPVGGAVPLF